MLWLRLPFTAHYFYLVNYDYFTIFPHSFFPPGLIVISFLFAQLSASYHILALSLCGQSVEVFLSLLQSCCLQCLLLTHNRSISLYHHPGASCFLSRWVCLLFWGDHVFFPVVFSLILVMHITILQKLSQKRGKGDFFESESIFFLSWHW